MGVAVEGLLGRIAVGALNGTVAGERFELSTPAYSMRSERTDAATLGPAVGAEPRHVGIRVTPISHEAGLLL